jgi:hypothetical protein
MRRYLPDLSFVSLLAVHIYYFSLSINTSNYQDVEKQKRTDLSYLDIVLAKKMRCVGITVTFQKVSICSQIRMNENSNMKTFLFLDSSLNNILF